MMHFLKKKADKLIVLLWVAVVLASIKSIFTDTGFDNAYTVAMSYRHLNGDGMFQQMWEPHQTSIFFTDICMWLYHLVMPSYTGVMVYLQICGTLFFGVLCIFLYRLLKDITGKQIAHLACIFLFMFRAKQTPFPDFANLQIGFSVLVFLCLVKFLNNQQKRVYLSMAAVFLCLEILSYPSCLLAYIPVVLILFFKSEKRWKNIGLFTAVCGVIGLGYVGYFIIKIGISQFIKNIGNIFYSDSHSNDYISMYSYFYGIMLGICWIIASAAIAWVIRRIAYAIWKRSVEFLPVFGLIMLISEIVMLFTQKKTGLDWTCTFYILPVVLMLLGLAGYKKMEEQEKTIWLTGMLLSIASFAATWLLTDLGLITIVSYMVLGGVVSFLPIRHMREQAVLFLLAVCATVTVHRGLVVWGYANRGNIRMVQDVVNIVRSGPSMGVVCDYMTYYLITYDREDHKQFVQTDDSFLIVGGSLIDSMEFLLTDADISNYSTIDTPIYNERMLEYFKLYPEKEPTVIAVSCWYGEMMVDPNSWVMKWIDENYKTVGDGRYWRYYRAK